MTKAFLPEAAQDILNLLKIHRDEGTIAEILNYSKIDCSLPNTEPLQCSLRVK